MQHKLDYVIISALAYIIGEKYNA